MNYKIPGIVRGTVLPYSVQEKIAKEEQEKKDRKKQSLKQFLHDLTITVISVLLSNSDKIFIFIANLIKILISE